MSKIEWTGETWNPILGCSIVSPGCTNCYAMKMAARLDAMGLPRYAGLTKPSKAGPVWTGKMALVEESLTKPLRRKKPTTWFVNSMGDLFHEDVPDEWIDRVFAVMALSRQHTFQVLTKRSARMREYVTELARRRAAGETNFARDVVGHCEGLAAILRFGWPLPNVWLGISAERQQEADARIPDLLATPAAVRFVSAEPLLGPIDFLAIKWPTPLSGTSHYVDVLRCGYWNIAPHIMGARAAAPGEPRGGFTNHLDMHDGGGGPINWIIVGGESGHDARPMHPTWARSIRDQCAAAGVPFFFKQWGSWAPQNPHPVSHEAGTLTRMTTISSTNRRDVGVISYLAGCGDGRPSIPMRNVGKKMAGRVLDGRWWDEMPARQAP